MPGRRGKSKDSVRTETRSRSRNRHDNKELNTEDSNRHEVRKRQTKKRKSSNERQNPDERASKQRNTTTHDNNEVQAVFREGDQMITFSAEGQNSEYNDSSDEEVILNPPNSQLAIQEEDLEVGEIPEERFEESQKFGNQDIEQQLSPEQTLAKVQELMARGGFVQTASFLEDKMRQEMKSKSETEQQRSKEQQRHKLPPIGRGKSPQPINQSNNRTRELDEQSEATIYKNAVNVQGSSSSELNSSDEILGLINRAQLRKGEKQF